MTAKGGKPWNDGLGQWRINHAGYRHRWATVDGKRVSILEHREVMERILGRALRPDELVHHINGCKSDNRPENLEVTSPEEHTRHHSLARPHPRGISLQLSDAERQRRREQMANTRRAYPSWNAGTAEVVTLVCAVCGGSFERRASVARVNRTRYQQATCSRRCALRVASAALPPKRAILDECDRLAQSGREVCA